MRTVTEILNSVRGLELQGEDGELLRCEIRPPVLGRELMEKEERIGAKLPSELKELLLYSNGISFFGQLMLPLEQLEYFAEQGLLTFHDWGNGDFDCLAMSTSRYSENAVVFLNHSAVITVEIDGALASWLERAVEEIRQRGTLLHPGDYRTISNGGVGVYSSVITCLDGVDCELNR